VQSIALPTTVSGSNKQLVASGTATSEGFLTRSTDGQYLILTGYASNIPAASSLPGTTASAVNRTVGRVDATGAIDTSTALTDFASSGNPRGIASDNGTRFWISGSTGGSRYVNSLGATTSTQLSTTATNLRATAIFGGQLYVSAQTGAIRVATVGTGTPTTSGQTITNLSGFPTSTTSPYGFVFFDLDAGVPGVDTLYVASDDAAVLTKYSLVSGNWASNGTVGAAADAYRGLTATVSGSTVTLYATRKGGSGATGGGELVSLTDSSGYNGAFSGSPTLLATAASNTAFRGVALAPVPPPPPLPNLSIDDVSLNETNAGTTIFTFTVNLSAPAGPGGVTFDIATADGTAQDGNPGGEDNDYVAKSLSGQTIPSGSSTYTFDVTVNGDTTPETNETFFVNVTSVTGANVTDGQGQGTIQNDDVAPNLTINDVSLFEENVGTTTFTFTVSLSAPAGIGGVSFDIATADGTAQDDNPATEDNDYVAKSLPGQTIPEGSSTYTFDVLVNADGIAESDETFFVNVTNVTNAIATDGQGQGTLINDDLAFIHDLQGNGAATPIPPGAVVMVEGVVTATFQGTDKLRGFFLQEEDAHADADPATSEGIFVFCGGCPTPVAEGQRVRATGTVSEFNGMTEITASTAPSVLITDAGNNLAEVTPASIDLPVVGVIDDFYETKEGMLVTFVDTLTVSEYFELARFGHVVLFEGGRPQQFTETSPPSVAGYTAHLDNLARRKVILDDDDNAQNAPLLLPDGSQFVYHPRANGGFSVGVQGTDFFRGGDLVNGLTGVLHWSFPGTGANTWRIRPTDATPATFTVANPRPATPPAVGGAIQAASMNLLNYFTTIDTTASSSSGPCGPSMTQDCRGADSVAELNRQRERASIVICGLNAHVLGLMELENTTATGTITDLLGAVNALCGGANPYAFVDTGSTLGTDAIRVALIYRSATLSPVGPPLVDPDLVHNRPPTAQTFDVVDPANPAFGERFTVIANHFKSKSCSGASGPDLDAGDGASCFNATRTAQANRLLTWINSTVLPAAGDPDVLLLGDFNSHPQETPVTTLTGAGFTDIETAILGPAAYSYLFDGQLGHIDYAFSSASLTPQVTGIGAWHINADEPPLFDYNDEVFDSPGEASFEEKPDGSALATPRNVFQPASPFRAADHDPVLVGLFPTGDFFIVTPCRAVDTVSGSPLQDGVPQTFALHGVCGIPPTATTVVLNVTVVNPTGEGELKVYPSDGTAPDTSMPFPAATNRALFVIVSLSSDAAGEVTVQPSIAGSGTARLLLDVMGYFE
jgi:predicted extracellular nuclease